MSVEDMTKDLLLQTLQTQREIGQDIADIKATVKEAAQIMTTLNRDVADLRSRLERCEKHPSECTAARRHSAWALSAKDLLWLVGFAGVVWALWQGK